MIFLRVPLCYLLSHETALRERGLWLGITISAIIGAAAFYVYYISGRWKKYTPLNVPPECVSTVTCIPEETM
jgi:Na+-driven multidrug efflux pump